MADAAAISTSPPLGPESTDELAVGTGRPSPKRGEKSVRELMRLFSTSEGASEPQPRGTPSKKPAPASMTPSTPQHKSTPVSPAKLYSENCGAAANVRMAQDKIVAQEAPEGAAKQPAQLPSRIPRARTPDRPSNKVARAAKKAAQRADHQRAAVGGSKIPTPKRKRRVFDLKGERESVSRSPQRLRSLLIDRTNEVTALQQALQEREREIERLRNVGKAPAHSLALPAGQQREEEKDEKGGTAHTTGAESVNGLCAPAATIQTHSRTHPAPSAERSAAIIMAHPTRARPHPRRSSQRHRPPVDHNKLVSAPSAAASPASVSKSGAAGSAVQQSEIVSTYLKPKSCAMSASTAKPPIEIAALASLMLSSCEPTREEECAASDEESDERGGNDDGRALKINALSAMMTRCAPVRHEEPADCVQAKQRAQDESTAVAAEALGALTAMLRSKAQVRRSSAMARHSRASSRDFRSSTADPQQPTARSAAPWGQPSSSQRQQQGVQQENHLDTNEEESDDGETDVEAEKEALHLMMQEEAAAAAADAPEAEPQSASFESLTSVETESQAPEVASVKGEAKAKALAALFNAAVPAANHVGGLVEGAPSEQVRELGALLCAFGEGYGSSGKEAQSEHSLGDAEGPVMLPIPLDPLAYLLTPSGTLAPLASLSARCLVSGVCAVRTPCWLYKDCL